MRRSSGRQPSPEGASELGLPGHGQESAGPSPTEGPGRTGLLSEQQGDTLKHKVYVQKFTGEDASFEARLFCCPLWV